MLVCTESHTGQIMIPTCAGFHMCMFTPVSVSSHSQIQLSGIKKNNKKKKLVRDEAERPHPHRGKGWAQMADGRCNQAEEQAPPDMWKSLHIKQREVLRQSLTAATLELHFLLAVTTVTQSNWSWVVGWCHLLVDMWNYNPGRKSRGKGKKE